jgi:murein DD-endopeptidase MepM/ murein hydrolase activator NlpD
MKKRKQKRYYSIMVIPHETGKPKTLRVSSTVIRFLSFLFILGVAASAVFIANQSRLVSQAMRASSLERENGELKRRNELIVELARRMDRFEELYEQIGGMLGSKVTLGEPLPQPAEVPGSDVNPEPGSPGLIEAGKRIPGELASRGPIEKERAVPSSWPLTRHGYITRKFTVLSDSHPGIDIAVPRNTPVKATGDGIVLDARYDPMYGSCVLIDHGNGFSSFYAHNTRLCVTAGQRVRKNDLIAFSGSTGASTAPHLHYELRKDGVPVDPQLYLR